MTILITGTAGFIGFHTAKVLLERGEHIVGIDCVTDYYDPHLKEDRLAILKSYPGFTEERFSIADHARLASTFKHVMPQKVIHLAAQAGVRYSVEYPLRTGRATSPGFCISSSAVGIVVSSTSSTPQPVPSTGPTKRPLS